MSVICGRGTRSTLPVRTAANSIRSSHERPFSTSKPNGISLQLNRNDPEDVKDVVPAYPYGPARWYKQSGLGLYGGQRIQFGNNVGEKFGVKTRRSWHPNVVNKNLFSKSLGRFIQLRVTTRTLRTIDKLGGLDEYLLGEKEARIKALGESGWWLRWAIMQTPVVKSRFAREKKRLAREAGLSEQDLEEHSQERTEETIRNQTEQNIQEEVEEGIEVASEAEVYGAMEHGDAVADDGVFTVDTSDNLPALKFRAGPRAYLVLTPNGWRRVRRSEEMHAQAQAKRKAEQRLQRYGLQFNTAIEKAQTFLAEEASKAKEDTTWNIKTLFSTLRGQLGGPEAANGWLKTIPKGQETIGLAGLQQLQAALESKAFKRSAMVSGRTKIENLMLGKARERVQQLNEKSAKNQIRKNAERSRKRAVLREAAKTEAPEEVQEGAVLIAN